MIKVLLICMLIMSLGLSQTNINSLGEIDNAVKHKEGQSFLDEQLHGIKSKSPFLTQLPKWITDQQLHDTFSMKYTMVQNALLGLKSWRIEENTFVGIGCYEDKVEEKERPYCGDYSGDTKRLVSIFSEPMYSFSDTAGEWHKDGTRTHHISEGKNILIVLKTMHNGYYDLKVKDLDSKFFKIFVFDKLKNIYVVKQK